MLSSLRTNNKSGKSFENQHQDEVIIITTMIVIVAYSCIYITNNAKSCEKFNKKTEKASFSDFTVWLIWLNIVLIQKAVFAQINVFVLQ